MPEFTMEGPTLKSFIETRRYASFAKQSKFFVEIGTPPMVIASNQEEEDDIIRKLNIIQFYTEQTQFPEYALMTMPSSAHSINIEMPYNRAYGPVTMTFMCDREMHTKFFFDKWVHGVYNRVGGIMNYYADYVSPFINIYQVAEDGKSVYCVTLYNAYPKIVNDIVLAANSSDISRFQVVFTYEEWVSYKLTPTRKAFDYYFPKDFLSDGKYSRLGKTTKRGELSYYGGDNARSSGGFSGLDFLKNVTGISNGLDLINKIKDPKLLKDSLRRSATSYAFNSMKTVKESILSRLPSAGKQIGGSVLGRVGGRFGF